MIKPFEVVELLARVAIVLRRYHKLEDNLVYADIEADVENQKVKQAGEIVELTPKEFELLVFFMRNQNITRWNPEPWICIYRD